MPGYDYIFVGAGIATGSTAWHLVASRPGARILILDRLPYYGMESTGKSASGVRNLFTSRVNRQLAHFSIQSYRELDASLRGSADFPDGLSLAMTGYLWLFDAKNREQHAAVLAEMRAEGTVEFVEPDEIGRRFMPGFVPRVSEELRGVPLAEMLAEAGDDGAALAAMADERAYLDDVVLGAFAPGCGYLDPSALANFYYARLQKSAGVEFRFRTDVSQLLESGGRVTGVRAMSGGESREFQGDQVILAAGAHLHDFLARRGLGDRVLPRNRMLFNFGGDGVKGLFVRDGRRVPFPFVVFYNRVYFRPDGEHALIGRADQMPAPPPGPGDDPPPYRQWVDDRYFSHVIRPLLGEHVPQFTNGVLSGRVSGLYEYTPDRAPIIGPFPGTDGLWIIGGFSGSGIMKAHAAGLLLAHRLTTGEATVNLGGEILDGSVLGIERFERPERWLRESFVI